MLVASVLHVQHCPALPRAVMVDVHRGEPEIVADLLLRHRQPESERNAARIIDVRRWLSRFHGYVTGWVYGIRHDAELILALTCHRRATATRAWQGVLQTRMRDEPREAPPNFAPAPLPCQDMSRTTGSFSGGVRAPVTISRENGRRRTRRTTSGEAG